MDDQRRWMTLAQAADYCGIGDKGYFLKLAKVYHLPRYGHSKRMFDRFGGLLNDFRAYRLKRGHSL